MLIKASTVIGLPVFTIHQGRKIDSVEDVIYSPKGNKIEALLIQKEGWFSEAKLVLFEDVRNVGGDVVLIESDESVKNASDVEADIEYIAKNETYLTGTRIITTSGRTLGQVTDLYFDARTGSVEEFEVSEESTQSHELQKKRIKISDIITIGEDATIVQMDEDEISQRQQVHQLRTVMSKTREVLPGIVEQAKKNLKEAGEKIREQAERLSDGIKERGEEVKTQHSKRKVVNGSKKVHSFPSDMPKNIMQKRKKEVVGLYLTKNILTSDDRILAKEGEMVTHKMLNEAEKHGVLDPVLGNVTSRVALVT